MHQEKLLRKWTGIALVNLSIVALLGVLLRCKQLFSLPVIQYKYLLHAHSHFAFSAWASTALFAIIVAFFLEREQQESKTFSRLFILNQVMSYGMLVSFLLQEYGPVSIAFSTLSIFVSYAYAWQIWKYTRGKSSAAIRALRFSLICLVVSSIGPFSLAYMMATHFINLFYFNGAVYLYLHFQYNGWFSFAVFAIVLQLISSGYNEIIPPRLNTFLNIMIAACFPSYLVSLLWIAPPDWVFIIAGIAGLLQLIATVVLLKEYRAQKKEIKKILSLPGGKLLYISFISLVIKLGLQFFCVFPELNKFVFGHRPVIIGYLHLVLVGFLTCFLIGISLRKNVLSFRRKYAVAGLLVFISGFIIQELGLLMDGIDNVLMTPMHAIPPILFIAAVMMLLGIIFFAISQKKTGGNLAGPEENVTGIKIPGDTIN